MHVKARHSAMHVARRIIIIVRVVSSREREVEEGAGWGAGRL